MSLEGCAPVAACVSVLLALSACSLPFTSDDPCGGGATPPPVKELTEPAYPEVAEADANVGVKVNTNLPSRVTVSIDRKVALDIELPGFGADCMHPPVYSYYDVPRGRVQLTVDSNDGGSKTVPMTVGRDLRWVLVMTQRSFPVHLSVSRQEPAFG